MSATKPVGKVHVLDAAARKLHSHAVFAVILCEDEGGNAFHFEAACFNFDLKPGHPLVTTSNSAGGARHG